MNKEVKSPKSAKIITIFNQKGGCGKSMTSMQLGGSVALRGYRCLVIDMDRQGTIGRWFSAGQPETKFPANVISLAANADELIERVRGLVNEYDFIFIDCPPAIESTVPWAALNVSDLGIIPVIPVLDNYWGSEPAKTLGLRAAKENPLLSLYYLPSNVRRGRLIDACIELLRDDSDIAMFDNWLSQRNAFAESQAMGCTVHALSNTQATQELESLTDEFLEKALL